MRSVKMLCLVLLLCGMAAAQATVIGGTASNWIPAYGVYAAPFVPLVVTPSVTLTTVSPSAVGASDATFGNVAGATDATLSNEFVANPPTGVYTQPVWYGPSGPGWYGATTVAAEGAPERELRHVRAHGIDVGVGISEGNVSAVQLMSAPGRKASRTYTNQDTSRMNDTNGTVKYDGKVEHI